MSLIFRLLWVFLTQTRGCRSRGLFDVQRVHSIALPNDLDLNLHVNNGRLMTYVDFGRMDWLYRCGVLQQAYRHGFIPIIGDISVRFLKPLKVFERFTIESRVLGWDAKWGYFEHRIVKRNGDVVLMLVNRGLFWKRGKGALPIATVLAGTPWIDQPSPQLPQWVRTWSASLGEARESMSRPSETMGRRSDDEPRVAEVSGRPERGSVDRCASEAVIQ